MSMYGGNVVTSYDEFLSHHIHHVYIISLLLMLESLFLP